MCAGLIFALLPMHAFTADQYITPYLGYRSGGDFDDVTTDRRVDVDDGDFQGLIYGWQMAGGQFEIVYARQATELSSSRTVSADALVDVDFDQLLVAGRKTLDDDIGSYIGVLIGFTHIDFEGSEFESDTRPALGLGGGIEYPLGERLGLRVGLQGIFTFVDNKAGAFCKTSVGCPIKANDNSLEQWDLFAGLTFRF